MQKSKKKTFLFLSFSLLMFISTIEIFSQVSMADSLLKILPFEKNDSLKIVILRDIGFSYYRTNPVKSKKYLLEAMELAKKTNNKFQFCKALIDYGSLQIDMGKYDTAIVILTNLLADPYSEAHYKIKGPILGNLATVYLDQDNYIKAQQCYLQAIEIFEKNNDQYNLVISYGNLCLVLIHQKFYAKTIQYAEKLYNLGVKNNDKESVTNALSTLSSCYTRTGNYTKALIVLNQSLSSALTQDNSSQLFYVYSNFGEYYLATKDYDKAVIQLVKADSIGRTLTYNKNRGVNLSLLGKAYTLKNDYTKAKSVLQKAESMLTGIEKKNELRELYQVMAEVEKKSGSINKAYDYLSKYASLKDSTYDDATSAKIAELEISFQTAKKEKDILILKQESDNKTARIEETKRLAYFLIGSFLTLLLISFLSFRNYKNKQTIQAQQIKELEQERQIVAADSILKGQEDERSRLAKDLHDGLGGMLSSIKMALSTFSNTLFMKGNQILPEESAEGLNRAISMLDSSIQELRSVARNLMPEALVKFGLRDALQDFTGNINQSGTLQIDYQTFGLEERLEQNTEIVVFRIVQELLNNAIKHAEATNVMVQLVRTDNRLSLTVEDNGKGLDVRTLETAKGIGWTNIQSRVNYLNGKLDIDSQPGKGTSVHIELPV
jgi:two-component system, NarL family, sensor kinase